MELENQGGIWKLTQHAHVTQLLDHQAVEVMKVRYSEHESVFSEAIRSQDEALRGIMQTIGMILQVGGHGQAHLSESWLYTVATASKPSKLCRASHTRSQPHRHRALHVCPVEMVCSVSQAVQHQQMLHRGKLSALINFALLHFAHFAFAL